MAEYIEREALIKRMEVTPILKYGIPTNVRDWVIDLAEKQPAADVVEVRHGEWVPFYSQAAGYMTNADRIRAMSDEELADFLSRLAYACDEPWSNLFALKFCYNCPEPEYTLDDGRKMNLHECDFKDGKCPHGSDVMWWLNQAAEEATK